MTYKDYIVKLVNLQSSSAPIEQKEAAIKELNNKWYLIQKAMKEEVAEYTEAVEELDDV
jgi:monomeric isocitrate dehydrogenase